MGTSVRMAGGSLAEEQDSGLTPDLTLTFEGTLALAA
jgi:hypothetical protein